MFITRTNFNEELSLKAPKMDTEIFEKSINSINYFFKIYGFDLNCPNKKGISNFMLNNYKYIFNFIWVLTALFGESYWFLKQAKSGTSLGDLTFIAPCVFFTLICINKSLQLFFNKNLIIHFLNALRELNVKNIEVHAEGNNRIKSVLNESMSFMRIIKKVVIISNWALGLIFIVSPLVVMAYFYYRNGSTDLMLPFIIDYPFNPHDIKMWPIAYIHQIWAAMCAVFYNIASDSLFIFSCSCLQMHFSIIRYRLEFLIIKPKPNDTVMSTNESSDKTIFDHDSIMGNFNNIIRDHQKLIDLVKIMNEFYSVSILVNFIASSFLICLTLFQVSTVTDLYLFTCFFIFLVTSLSQIFLLCYFGDMIIISSMSVGDGVYNNRWYFIDNKFQRKLLFVIARAQRPSKLTASKFSNIDLKAFTKILSTSWSYFALLRTVYNPDHDIN